MSRGPAKSGFNPSKEHYRCPLQNCFGKILLDKIYKCVSFEKGYLPNLLETALCHQILVF